MKLNDEYLSLLLEENVDSTETNEEGLDWIDDFAKIATKKQLKQERRNLIKNKNVIKNYELTYFKLDNYIDSFKK